MSPGDKKDVLEATAENKDTDDKPEEEAEEAYDPLAFALASIMGTEGKFDVRKSPVKPINPLRDVRVSLCFTLFKGTPLIFFLLFVSPPKLQDIKIIGH